MIIYILKWPQYFYSLIYKQLDYRVVQQINFLDQAMEAATKKLYNLVRVWMWEPVIEVLELLKRKFGNERNFCTTARELPI